MMNTIKTILLLGLMTGLMMGVGSYLGGREGLVAGFLIALVTNIGSYWFSAPLALSMSRAVPIERSEAPELYDVVERIAQRAKIPAPRVYLIPTDSPNAFATGRDPEHSSIAVTQGIMRILDMNELEAVLSHELGHVRNRDVLITTIAAVLASVVTYIAHWGMYFGGGSSDDDRPNPIFMIAMMILAPLAATLINLAISRSREYEADATGAELCGHPMALASALNKIEQWSQRVPFTSANPALSSLYIIKPNPRSWLANLFSTHPATADRIARLEQMQSQMAKRM